MISLNETEKRKHYEWISSGQFIKQMFANVMSLQKPRMYDGYIHSSKLDWSMTPEKQFESHLKGGHNIAATNGYTRAGDIFHEDIQRILTSALGENGAYPEYRFQFPEMQLQGTVDRLQLGTPVGNILFEFKTTSSLQKDKTGGTRLYGKLEKLFNQYLLRETEHPATKEAVNKGLMNRYHLLTNTDVEQIHERLNCKPTVIEPQVKHETQMFTYCWALSSMVKLDWACLIYITRDSYEFTEFWYPIAAPEVQAKIVRAYDNFMGVRQCLIQYHQQNSGSVGQPGLSTTMPG